MRYLCGLGLFLFACGGSPAVGGPDMGADLAGGDLAQLGDMRAPGVDGAAFDLAGFDLTTTTLPGQNGGPCAGTACATGLRCMVDPADPVPSMCLSGCYGGRAGQPCIDSNCNSSGYLDAARRCEFGLICTGGFCH